MRKDTIIILEDLLKEVTNKVGKLHLSDADDILREISNIGEVLAKLYEDEERSVFNGFLSDEKSE